MQNTMLFRRGIVLPLDSDAVNQLRESDVDEKVAVRYLEIQDLPSFETLWTLGLFQAINARAGSLIDDYEEEFIEATKVGCVLQAVAEVRSRVKAMDAETHSFLDRLSDLASEAERLKLPLLFVL